MANIYKSRWKYITMMFTKIKPYVENPKYKVELEGCEVSHLEINDKEIFSYLHDDKTCIGSWAENNKDFDHGLYTTILEWKKWFDEKVKIYTVENVKWM